MKLGKIAKSLLGTETKYSDKTKKNVTGMIKDWRPSMAIIMNMKTKKKYPAIEFLIKPSNGGRAFWTRPFHNK